MLWDTSTFSVECAFPDCTLKYYLTLLISDHVLKLIVSY